MCLFFQQKQYIVNYRTTFVDDRRERIYPFRKVTGLPQLVEWKKRRTIRRECIYAFRLGNGFAPVR